MKKHGKLVHTPAFFNSEKADQNYQPDIGAAFREGIAFGLENKLAPATLLLARGNAHALMMTDLQEDFRDNGRLPVKETNRVVLNTCVRLINGVVADYYAGIFFSLDGHHPFHISFDHYWRDSDGRPMDLSKHGKAAILTLVDEANGLFKATAFGPDGPYEIGLYRTPFGVDDSIAYWKHLRRTRQGDIWVFVPHCLLGTDGVNLHPLLVETIAFACGARDIQPVIIQKGHLYNTDWFGPLEACRPDMVQNQGVFRDEIIELMKMFEAIEFSGVAEDFCDYYMKWQTLSKLSGTPYLKKLRFIQDCTAPIIPNAKHVWELNARAMEEGVKFILHDEPF